MVLVEPDLFYSAQDRGPHRFGELEADREISDLKNLMVKPYHYCTLNC